MRYFIWFYGNSLTKAFNKTLLKIKLNNVYNINTSIPSIYVCNHNAASDAFILGVLPKIQAVMFVQGWVFKNPIFGFFAKNAEYLNIQNHDSEYFINRSIELLNKGVSIIIFPEGTRAGKAPLGKFHSLAFKIAKAAKVPIVPIVITGNRECPIKGSAIIKPSKIIVSILAPIQPNYFEDLNTFVLKNKIKNIISEEMKVLEKTSQPPILSYEKTKTLMPHKPPMLLVDELIESTEIFGIAKVTIRQNNIFIDNNGNLDTSIFPELIAQTAALKKVYENEKNESKKTFSGFVVSFKNFVIKHNVKVFDTLMIRIEDGGVFENLSIIKGKITCSQTIIAEGEVRIWLE